MTKKMNLNVYVKRRNGVSMGAKHSLRNMLLRSLGAGKFSVFWIYWNPIFSYYLGKYIFKPLKIIFPPTMSLILTFVFCGMLHDTVSILVSWEFKFLFTPWFLLMSLCVVFTEFIKLEYSEFSWPIRAFINLSIIGSCLFLAYQIKIIE